MFQCRLDFQKVSIIIIKKYSMKILGVLCVVLLVFVVSVLICICFAICFNVGWVFHRFVLDLMIKTTDFIYIGCCILIFNVFEPKTGAKMSGLGFTRDL